ncbi:MAG: gephyrin-like molybdotransferase Glp [Nitriliruptoraceae bacterium]
MSGFVGHGLDEVTPADQLVGVEDHLAGILEMLPALEAISLRLVDALGLVLAENVASPVSVPAFANSAMDGYAVMSADLALASRETPITLVVDGEIPAGAQSVPQVDHGRTVRIMTGAPIPPGADAVVPVELTVGDLVHVSFHTPVNAGMHVRRPGEDIRPGQPLMAAGRRISSADIALLAAAGVTRITCVPPPRVVVMSTGDELVRAEDEVPLGKIRDSNGPMLSSLVRAAGGLPYSAGIVPDDRKALMNAFDTNSGHADLFICTGGASAGTRDLIPAALESLGEVTTAKVAMKPGMPQIRGRVGDVPVIGLPGNPVSAFVSFEVFARPAIRALQGRRDVARPMVTAIATAPLFAPLHKRGYSRVTLRREGATWLATPAGAQGSHIITSIAQADGLAIVPEHVTEIPEGGRVVVHLLVD